ncbi:reverse transcriptase-like protein [Halapricum desulfuricans]|uniref:Ribonuclease HI n=1 Tax=Halapricum desulfuricans TaxID=2841257 RepID=A0A897NUZ7_9EURY|nr:reverse transcriptase-like protein [Halapricum desulfuricans]QSG15365.1 Ribonuclease HI [Halapricum desulfuricans]
MAAYGRPSLRDLFDESPTPHIAHPPRTHHRDFYVATDGSLRDDGGGLGVVIETRDGERVDRLSLDHTVSDNNVAEYRALHLGLDVLADRTPSDARVGVLVDHDQLASNVNAAVLDACRSTAPSPHQLVIPPATTHHWRGIRARINGFDEIRAARIASADNPAHPLANAPGEYGHVNDGPDRCIRPDPISSSDRPIPPPSRSDRGASD